MEMEFIAPLQKIKIAKETVPQKTEGAGCCGGEPVSNADACCKLDEEKKAEGEAGCGCNTAKSNSPKSSCC